MTINALHMLSEPVIVSDTYVSGLADAEDLEDGTMRFTLYARQKSLHDYDGAFDYIVVARIVMPLQAVIDSVQQTMKALGIQCCGGERIRLRH